MSIVHARQFTLGSRVVLAGAASGLLVITGCSGESGTDTTTVVVTEEQEPQPQATAEPTAAEEPSSDEPAGNGDEPPTSFTMPNEVGKTLQVAQDHLQQVSANPVYFSMSNDATGANRSQVLDSNWKVCSQEPAVGETVGENDTVTLSAVKLNETCP